MVKNNIQNKKSAKEKEKKIENKKVNKENINFNKLNKKIKSSTKKEKKIKKNINKKEDKKTSKKPIILPEKKTQKRLKKDKIQKEKITSKKEIKEEKEENKEKDLKMIKIISKNDIVVDSLIPQSQNYHVVKDDTNTYNGEYFSCTLNKSNLERNNNKFYILQLLQSEIDNSYYLFIKWGRVGVKGKYKLEKCSLEYGKKKFMLKYKDKTGRNYKEIKIDYSNGEDDNKEMLENKDEKNKKENKSTEELHKILSDKVIELIELIYDKNILNHQMKEIGYDSSKMPLGKLAKESLEKGYLILKNIEKELQNKSPSKTTLTQLSSDFYTYIPHDFGFQKMYHFIIDSLEKVKSKIDMIETLKDMKVATKIINETIEDSQSKIILNYYQQLHCKINHIPKTDKIYSLLEKYLSVKINNKSDYSYYNTSLKLLEAYELKREGEEERYLKNLSNKKLLWHGTRISNYVGILSQGLRIAPPEAPSSGYLFGKGLYFADMSSKSCNYCYPVNNIGLILLCEVALGNIEKRFSTDYSLPNTMNKGNNSILGVGKIYPSDGIFVEKNLFIPCEKVSVNNEYAVSFDEFIVYDVRQVKLRYLLKIQYD
jgi:poly [ADP-ribose] polymerase